MSSTRGSRGPVCQLLREDPDLADAIPVAQRAQAIKDCVAMTVRIDRGRWSSDRVDIGHAGIGLLVLEGLITRSVGLGGRFGAELLGVGDLLRPWQGQNAPVALTPQTAWRTLKPTRIALLDEPAARRLARYPELIGTLVGRALERSRNLAMNMAIVHQPRIDIRLHMLFWHLAGRWGQVRSDGVAVSLPLTHTVLARLIAARRPSVTTALAQLARQELVTLIDDGWLLSGSPPGELTELDHTTVRIRPEKHRG
jgi:CRP/FNR family transcriptional regulator, cyclic AMP receptor protein